MFPDIKNNQILFVKKSNFSLKPFENIIIYLKNQYIVKKLIGLPGDLIEFQFNKIYRNNKDITNFFYKYKKSVDNYSLIVPNEKIFVLGVNINESIDSRFIGFISISNVYGTVLN